MNLATPSKAQPETPGRRRRLLSWLPIPLFVVATAIVHALQPQITAESRTLVSVLYTLFCASPALIVAFLAGQTYLENGSVRMMLLGLGAVFFGIIYLVAALLLPDYNAGVTVHNFGFLLSGICFLLSGLITDRKQDRPGERRWRNLILAYAVAAAVMAAWIWSAYEKLLPTFYVTGAGYTSVRNWILGFGLMTFAACSLRYWLRYLRTGSRFDRWFCQSVAIIGVAMVTAILIPAGGTVMAWVARVAQCVGGIYMLLAILTAVQDTGAWRVPLDQALHRQETQYRELVQNANSAIIRWKKDGTISFFNEYAQDLFGYSGEEIIGKNVGILVPEIESNGADLTTLVEDIVAHHERYVNNINENVCRDGRRVWMIWTNKAIYDESGQVSEILAVGSDVTERKRTEEALQESEERLRVATEAARAGMWSVDIPSGRWEFSPQAANIFGLSDSELISAERIRALTHPDDRERLTRQSEQALGELGAHELEYRVVRPDGAVRWVLLRGRTDPDEEGRLWRNIGVVLDITDRKRMEEEIRKSRDELDLRVKERTAEVERANDKLRRANRRLEELNKELQNFAFVASHDLKEPLRKIRSFGDMLVKSGADETSRDYIDRMQAAAKRMQSLLNSLLSYSRVTTQAEPMKETDLGKSVEVALSNLEITIREENGRVEVGELPTVHADRVQMIQLFQNLIGNALKYHRNGETPNVKIYAGVGARESVEISVEDNGIGFEEKYLDRIFLPFQRLHGTKSDYEGVGMGLAICKKIVERHGGEITARSESNKGSTFVVTLPRKRDEG